MKERKGEARFSCGVERAVQSRWEKEMALRVPEI